MRHSPSRLPLSYEYSRLLGARRTGESRQTSFGLRRKYQLLRNASPYFGRIQGWHDWVRGRTVGGSFGRVAGWTKAPPTHLESVKDLRTRTEFQSKRPKVMLSSGQYKSKGGGLTAVLRLEQVHPMSVVDASKTLPGDVVLTRTRKLLKSLPLPFLSAIPPCLLFRWPSNILFSKPYQQGGPRCSSRPPAALQNGPKMGTRKELE